MQVSQSLRSTCRRCRLSYISSTLPGYWCAILQFQSHITGAPSFSCTTFLILGYIWMASTFYFTSSATHGWPLHFISEHYSGFTDTCKPKHNFLLDKLNKFYATASFGSMYQMSLTPQSQYMYFSNNIVVVKKINFDGDQQQ